MSPENHLRSVIYNFCMTQAHYLRSLIYKSLTIPLLLYNLWDEPSGPSGLSPESNMQVSYNPLAII